MEEKTYAYKLTDTTLELCPIMLHEGVVQYGPEFEDTLNLPISLPIMGNWGEGGKVMKTSNAKFPMPSMLDATWLSIVEKKFYSIYDELPQKELAELWELKDKEENPVFNSIVVGFGPHGRVAVWARGFQRCEQVLWAEGSESDLPFEEFFPKKEEEDTLESYCQEYLDDMQDVNENLQRGLPSAVELDDMMQQYTYRYHVLFQHFDTETGQWQDYPEGVVVPEVEAMSNLCADASFDRLEDGRLQEFHKAAKPISIYLRWWLGTSDYSCYINMAPDDIQPYLDIASIEDSDEPVEVEIKVDWEQNKYQILLKSELMDKGILLPDEMTKIIVFRAGYEDYKTPNFDLSEAAWMW